MIRSTARMAVGILALCLLGVVLAPSAASAQAILHAGVVGSEIHVGVTVYWGDMPASYTGVVVQRWTDGLCDDGSTVTPAPWPRPENNASGNYGFSEPIPRQNLCYGYVVRAVDAEGGLHAVESAGEQAFDFVSVGTAIVSRGTLAFNVYDLSAPLFTACAAGCWKTSPQLDLSALDPASYNPYLNQGVPLDIYGQIVVSDMLPNVGIVVSQVVPTSSGQCGPVPVQPMSWGQVKSVYR